MVYTPKDNRDAWFVIRGFVYQVNLTILKWIELEENQFLELERGEDIDVITSNFDNEEELRSLGQVKHRDGNVTLNSTGVLEILRNFHDHIIANPHQDLLFSYITNSNYGLEKPVIFVNGKKGIEVWMELFNDDYLLVSNIQLSKIQKHILKKIDIEIKGLSNPSTDSEKQNLVHWNNFRSYIEDSKLFISFLKRFEWSLNNENSTSISQSIKSKLVELNFSQNSGQAEMLYPRLFLKIFNLLSKNGIKKVGLDLLKEELLLPEINGENTALLAIIQDNININEKRIVSVENRVEAVENQSKEFAELLDTPKYRDLSSTVFNHQLSQIEVNKPNLIANGSLRVEKVKEITNNLVSNKWINIQGVNGCGKSQLSSLVAEKFKKVYWLDLRPFVAAPSKCLVVLKHFLLNISGINFDSNSSLWIEKTVKSLDENSLIIFNDLPNYSNNNELFNLIRTITDYIKTENISILSSSNHKINQRKLHLTNEIFMEFDNVAFDEQEIIELLENYGAPQHTINSSDLIASVSRGNPRFIIAILYHLQSTNWSDNILEIFSDQITNELLNDEQEAITYLIEDSKTKELLYRLSLIHWDFHNNEILSVSNVQEIIEHPNEKFRQLLNIWIQGIANSNFQISPLIKDIGTRNLSPETQKKIYKSLASQLMSSGKLNPLTGFRVIKLYEKAGSIDEAIIILIKILGSAETKKSVENLKNWGFLDFWITSELPSEVHISLKAKLRLEQIRALKLLQLDPSALLAEVEQLIKDTSLAITEGVMLRMLLLAHFPKNHNSSTIEIVSFIINSWSEIEESFKDIIDLNLISNLIWFPAKFINSEERLELWLELCSKVIAITDIDIFDTDHSQLGTGLIASQIIKNENQTGKNWKKAESLLLSFASYLKNKEILNAIVFKEIIYLNFDLKKDFKHAVHLAELKVKEYNTPLAKYLIWECVGKLFYNKKDHKSSRFWLDKAINPVAENQFNYIDTLIYGACAYSSTNSQKSVELTKKAVELAEKDLDINELDVILNKGELGIAYWINKQPIKVFYTFSEIIDTLFRIKKQSEEEHWVRLFKWAGHTLGYLAADLLGLEVPRTADSNEVYFKPYQGLFSFNNKDLRDIYNPEEDPVIYSQLAMIADAIGRKEETYTWASKAFNLARVAANNKIAILTSNTANPYMVINNKVSEALETQLLAAALSQYKYENNLSLEEYFNIDFEQLFSEKPSSVWSEAEDLTIGHSIIPLFILLLQNLIADVEKEKMTNNFLKPLEEYLIDASDKVNWEELLSLTRRISKKTLSSKELIKKGDEYVKLGKKRFNIICVLGVIFMDKPSENTIFNQINIIPYICQLNNKSNVIIRHILFPFVRERCISAIEESFVGSKIEFDSIITTINHIKNYTEEGIKQILKLSAETLDIDISDDRKTWFIN